MNRRFPLATVLRVRRVQEDLAQAGVVRARVAADLTRQRADALATDLAAHQLPAAPGGRWVAAARHGLVLAADAALAQGHVQAADHEVVAALGSWSTARGARRGVERLAERHADAVRAEDERLAQRDLDDRARRP